MPQPKHEYSRYRLIPPDFATIISLHKTADGVVRRLKSAKCVRAYRNVKYKSRLINISHVNVASMKKCPNVPINNQLARAKKLDPPGL